MPANSTTFFQPQASGGGSSGDYVIDSFLDISLPATNNTGWSTSILKNPLSVSLGNDDNPKFEYKTLWVKDLILIQDRTKWVNGSPTYTVVFTENYPGVYAYVYGNVRLRSVANGLSVDLRAAGDGFGITTIGRRVHWFLNSTDVAAQSASVFVDGALNGVTQTYTGVANTVGVNKYDARWNATTSDTRDIHDYRLQQNNAVTFNVSGVGVFFEISAGVIDCFPGSTYVNKDKKTTTTGATLAVPTLSQGTTATIGAVSTIYKNSSGGYALSTVERTRMQTTGSGTGGAGSVTVDTGTGASFPIGSGIAIQSAGSTHYVGMVTNVSTDTLTVIPNLASSMSGIIWKTWQAGGSYPISATLYQNGFSFDPYVANTLGDQNSFGGAGQNILYYQDPVNRFRAFGQSIIVSAVDGNLGVMPLVSKAFLDITGDFVAAELEWTATPGVTNIIHATYAINGCGQVMSQLQGVTGSFKQTVFTDGVPGWNQFSIGFGATHYGVALTKVNMYQLAKPSGVTLGALAAFETYGTQVKRTATNATMLTLGTNQRLYADQLYYTGAWTRGVTVNAAGGVMYQGVSTNAVCTINYFGKDFAVIGSLGASQTVALNGTQTGGSLGYLVSVATLGFHQVVISGLGNSPAIHAFDFCRPRSELINLQNFAPHVNLNAGASVYLQARTPQAPKAGDIWASDPGQSGFWMYLFNRWNKVNVVQSADDPQVGQVYYYGGNG